MTKTIIKLKSTLNNLSEDELNFIDKLFKQSSNLSIKVDCTSKISEILQRIEEIKNLHENFKLSLL